MTPGTKRTIITSKTTGRRYFLVRSASRPGGRRYYVCTNPTCKARVSREADLYCKAHAQDSHEPKLPESEDIADISAKSDQLDESDIQDNGEIIEEESSTKTRRNTKMDTSHTEQVTENGKDDVVDITDTIPADNPTSLSPNSELNAQIEVDEVTGLRTFRDRTGRRRYLCMQPSCESILKRHSDVFCQVHAASEKSVDNNKKKRGNQKRHSAPPASKQSKKNRFRSPFQAAVTTATPENGTNGNQSDEYETPKKKKNTPQRIGTTRSFRDGSGKLRFLCSIPTCHSRVPRQSELYCKRHLNEQQGKETETNHIQPVTTNGKVNEENVIHTEEMDVHQNDSTPFQQTTSETPIRFDNKKRKRDSSVILSSIPADKIIIATTALLDDQWTDALAFLRQFPQVQLSTNLNVNNFTTHLLVDDSENHLHCTITKKIVQAAVRHHIFIISSRWLNECMRLNTFIDEHPYEIISDSHTTLRLSKQELNISNKYLFGQNNQLSSYAFAIECRQCQGSINRSELLELIQLTGAQIFQIDQAIEYLIILCDTNDKNLNKIKEKYIHAPATNIKYVTSDFLLKSIIKFEIQDIEKYSL